MSAAAPQIRSTPTTRISQNMLGHSVSIAGGRRGWRHPWFTEAMWLPKKKAWAAFVLAGFVNGSAPMVRTTAGELRESRGAFFGQLVDARTGAAEIKQLAELASGGGEVDSGIPDKAVVDVPLYQNPPIGLHEWRNIGWDGAAAVPLFFQERGVSKPPPGVSSQLESGGKIAMSSLNPPKGNRLLRACDIILHQPRTALTSQIVTDLGSSVAGTGTVTQTLGMRDPIANDRLKIVSGTFSEIGQNALDFTAGTSLLASDYEEKTWDEIPVSTVYLLSPPDPKSPEPDATWQAFSAHSLFWNLSWAQRQEQPVFNSDIFRPLVALTGMLAGGAGLGAVSFLASSINDATQGALNILQAQSLAGTFWTPTGGGTTSATPVTTPAPAKPGLDKTAAATAKARAAAAAKRNRTLDPPFPFEGRRFNTALLS